MLVTNTDFILPFFGSRTDFSCVFAGGASRDEGGNCPSPPLCPDKCRCDEGIVDCRDRGLTHVPLHIPEDTTEL